MNLSYYVYYKVPAENAGRARAAVGAIQKELRDILKVGGRLLRRRDDESTWMEIYENVGDAHRFEAELAALVERHGLAPLLAAGSRRKLEIFTGF